MSLKGENYFGLEGVPGYLLCRKQLREQTEGVTCSKSGTLARGYDLHIMKQALIQIL